MMRNLSSIIKPKRLVAEATLTSSASAVVIDRGNTNSRIWEAIQLAFHVGAGGITFSGTNYLALKLRESDDNSTFNVVGANTILFGAENPAGTAFAQVPDTNGFVRLINAAKAAADTDPFRVDYVGSKRYLEATITFGGTHGAGTLVGLWAVLGYPNIMPVI
ncbi:hypothetical protein EDE12_11235 [Methylosinus sp. sav-2]|uniref:hypothetical protein n=1 Tax=Methylosinus sp. sav-2 TaxID=2485168 RepID=UPI00047E3342|nr:hypothetical protein [Methylosinus sp. sav-2]TDX61934.1 hypothetical protein EDE12_11235 [Methylosinus sp. sav-2]